jgi:predicted RNase H-like HicB family nuclease
VKRPGLHDKPWLAVKAGRASGSVVVVAKAAGDRATYEWQYSKVGEPWIDVAPTRQAKKVLDALVPGRVYQFRVRAVTHAGRSDFGDSVSFLVAWREEERQRREERGEHLEEFVETRCATVAGGRGQAEALEKLREALFEFVEDLRELGQALCATVAGGRGQAEAREELVEDLPELGQALCATVAGGRGQAKALEKLQEALFELVEDLLQLRPSLCATVAGGCGQTEALEELFEVLFELVEDLGSRARAAVVGDLRAP